MQNITKILSQSQNLILLKLLSSIIVILLLWIIRIVINKIISKQKIKQKNKYKWKKISRYIIIIIGIFIIGRIWFNIFQTLTTFLGLLSAGIAIALKDLVMDIAGWIYILSKNPFDLGDRIQIDNFSGDVVDVGVFEFTLLEIGNWIDADQSTGRIIYIPNSKILTSGVFNYNKEFDYIWDELSVLITFESNWKKAKHILQNILDKRFENIEKKVEKQIKKASKKLMIYYSKLTPIIYTSVKESGVLFTLRYLCLPKERRQTNHLLWEDILTEFSKHENIEFAYPTQRFYTDNKIKIKRRKKK